MLNMKSILLMVCMLSSAFVFSLNEEELAKMSLQSLSDLAVKQQKEEIEIGQKLIALKKTASELTDSFLKAKDQCVSDVRQNSFFSLLSCAQMKYFKAQSNLNNVMQEEEKINLEHSQLDAKLIRKYIAEKQQK